KLPKGHQTLLFSATYPDAIRTLAGAMLRNPVEVTVAGVDAGAVVEELFHEVDAGSRTPALAALLLEHRPESCVVFCNMRRDADEVAGSLTHYGFTALA